MFLYVRNCQSTISVPSLGPPFNAHFTSTHNTFNCLDLTVISRLPIIINTKETTMKFILTAVTLLASTAAVAAKEPKVLRGPVLVRYINSIVGLTIANEQTHTSLHLTNILVSPLPYIKYRLKTEHPRVDSSSPRKPRLLPPSSKMMSLLKQPRTRRRRFPSSSPLT